MANNIKNPPSIDDFNPDDVLRNFQRLQQPTEEEVKLSGQIESLSTPEAESDYSGKQALMGALAALGGGIAEYGKTGAGEGVAEAMRRETGRMSPESQQTKLQKALERLQAKRGQERKDVVDLAAVQSKLMPKPANRLEGMPITDAQWAAVQQGQKEAGLPLFEDSERNTFTQADLTRSGPLYRSYSEGVGTTQAERSIARPEFDPKRYDYTSYIAQLPKGIQDRFYQREDKIIKEAAELNASGDSMQNTLDLLNLAEYKNLAAAGQALPSQLARQVAGEKGVLTDRDVLRITGNQTLAARFGRLYNKWFELGQDLTPADQREFRQILETTAKRYKDKKDRFLKTSANSLKSVVGGKSKFPAEEYVVELTPLKAIDFQLPDVGDQPQAPAPTAQVTGPSVAPAFESITPEQEASLSPRDQQAIKFVRDNPNDPRANKIKLNILRKLGG